MAQAHRVAVIAGDGVGSEVVREGLRVLRAVADRFGFEIGITEYPFGTAHWVRTQEMFPDSATAEMLARDAVLLGAIGDPRAPAGLIERGIIGHLRWDLDLYVNLRPIKLLHEPISAVALMLDYLAEAEAARAIEDAITALVNTERIASLRVGATPTNELGGLVVEQLRTG